MKIYSEEFRQNALKMIESLGVKKTSENLHVGEMTLYTWKKKAIELRERQNEAKETPDANDKRNEHRLPDLPLDLKRELDELRTLNRTCQQTIEYLVEENTVLRQQCENYLRAISLISQK